MESKDGKIIGIFKNLQKHNESFYIFLPVSFFLSLEQVEKRKKEEEDEEKSQTKPDIFYHSQSEAQGPILLG